MRFFSELGLISVSLAIHGSLFLSLDRAISLSPATQMQAQQKILTQKAKDIQFEFVEAPPKTHPQKPKDSSRISDRDALNQDSQENESALKGTPYIQTQGVMDQLAQRPRVSPRGHVGRGSGSPRALRASECCTSGDTKS